MRRLAGTAWSHRARPGLQAWREKMPTARCKSALVALRNRLVPTPAIAR
jgi:hypothetical protein